MPGFPSGTVTFLFTDIEGSTRLWEQYPEAMALALARHTAIVTDAVELHGGVLVRSRGEGDSTFSVFSYAQDAVAAAFTLQRALHQEAWPASAEIRVRAALHTGACAPVGGDYNSATVNRCARLRSLGHGGQTLLSRTTYDLVRDNLSRDISFLDLGLHRLKDLQRPEQVYQLLHPDLPDRFPPLSSLDRLPTNLPEQLTSLVGREKEEKELRELVVQSRLVTAAGAGGVGKTRLAMQAAADCLGDFLDGVWLVELENFSDPLLIVGAIVSTLGIREDPSRTIRDTLLDYLLSRKILLVLDNCEHLVQECAELVHVLLRRCPQLHVLATSREALSIAGEVTYRVPSLAVPEAARSSSDSLAALGQCGAVQLFVERAAGFQPSFRLTPSNAPAILEICRRLDGIPLAIELAAARVKVLAVEDIARRLDDRFRLLTGGSRGVLPRHQTLRAAMEWSYDLLSQDERTLLRRLSVFAGGCTLEAAEAILPASGVDGSDAVGYGETIAREDVLDLLSRLADKSLIYQEAQEVRQRYRLLETVREYSRRRLEEDPSEVDAVTGRHVDYYVVFAEDRAACMRTSGEAEALDQMASELDNLRSAIRWTHGRERRELCTRLAAALYELLYRRGLWAEARQYLEMADLLPVEGATGSEFLASVIHRKLGSIALDMGDLREARRRLQASLNIARNLRQNESAAEALNLLGLLELEEGSENTARDFFEESLRLFESGSGEARVLHNLGLLEARRSQIDRARDYYTRALEGRRKSGDARGEAETLGGLGSLAHREDLREEARRLYLDSLIIRKQMQDCFGMAVMLNNLGDLAERDEDLEGAALLYFQARNLFRDMQAAAVTMPQEALRNLAATLDESRFREVEQQAEEKLDQDQVMA